MQKQHQSDAAFSHLMSNMLEKTSQNLELEDEPVNDRHEQLLALQRRFALQPAGGFVPGQIVQWKPGMRNRLLPADGQPAIVMEVLDPPIVLNDPTLEGCNLFREPLSLVLGVHDADGDFLLFHVDSRRFEIAEMQGVSI